MGGCEIPLTDPSVAPLAPNTLFCVPWVMRGPDPGIAPPLGISPQMQSELRKY